MYIIALQAIVLYLISGYLHRTLAYGSRTLYLILMFPGTLAHELSHAVVALLMGSRITDFSVIPHGDTLGYVEYTPPKIPLIGNTAISIAPLIGCPAILLLISSTFGVHFVFPAGSLDINAGIRFLIENTFSFIIGLDYLNWKTYALLYFIITLGAGAAPSKTDILHLFPGLIIIIISIYAMSYFGFNIEFLNNLFSALSSALTVAIIPLMGVTIMIFIIKLIF